MWLILKSCQGSAFIYLLMGSEMGNDILSVTTPNKPARKSLTVFELPQSIYYLMSTDRRQLFELSSPPSAQQDVIILLLLASGARIDEVLQLQYSNMEKSGLIYIPGKKHSDSRMVYEPHVTRFIFRNENYSDKRVFTLSYRQVYTYLKAKLNVHSPKTSGDNDAVSHWFRYTYIYLAYVLSGCNIEFVKKEIGHKAMKSTIHYLKGVYNGSANRRSSWNRHWESWECRWRPVDRNAILSGIPSASNS